MTPPLTPAAAAVGAPFGWMLRAALVPSAVIGIVTAVVVALVRGSHAWAGALVGVVVALAFFGSGMFLLSRLVRSASPGAFFAVAMTVYLGQVLALLLFLIAFHDAAWLDGLAFGIVVAVVTLVWQVFSMRALRTGRLPVYDEVAP